MLLQTPWLGGRPPHSPHLTSGLIGVARGARARYHGGEKLWGIISIGVSCKCTPGRARSDNFLMKNFCCEWLI